MKYIPAEKLIAEIERQRDNALERQKNLEKIGQETILDEMIAFNLNKILSLITSLQQEQSINMIQWTGNNLQEVIDFTGKSPKFGEWFKSWDEFESYVHSHGDILKLFSEDGSHFEVPVGAWIVKTPDGYNVPSVARFIHAKQEQPEVDFEKEIDRIWFDNKLGNYFDNDALDFAHIRTLCRHFYELGLNARKEE